MRLVLFEPAARRDAVPGLLTERGVVDIAHAVPSGPTPQATMQGVIDTFETLRPLLAEAHARVADRYARRPVTGGG